MKKKKTACIVFYTDDRYDDLVKNVKNSFLSFNGDEADYYQIDYTNKDKYDNDLQYFDMGDDSMTTIFLMQYIYAYEIMRKYNYEKVIILGSDTIVCSRLDEFLDDDETAILATLNYYIQEKTDTWTSPIIEVELPDGNKVLEHENVNADVVCFNNADALLRVITLSMEHFSHFSIQGGLNELLAVEKSFSAKIVDSPYPLSDVSYNARSKGVPRCEMIEKGKIKNCWPRNVHGLPQEWLMSRNLIDGQPSPIHSWYVKDKKLYTHDHKQIKCFHFVEGLGCQQLDKFYELINDFKTNWFNEDTKGFFRKECNCKEFFKIHREMII